MQGVFEDDESIHIVMELCLGGALMDRVKQVLPYPDMLSRHAHDAA